MKSDVVLERVQEYINVRQLKGGIQYQARIKKLCETENNRVKAEKQYKEY